MKKFKNVVIVAILAYGFFSLYSQGIISFGDQSNKINSENINKISEETKLEEKYNIKDQEQTSDDSALFSSSSNLQVNIEKKDEGNLQENSGNDNLGNQDPKIVEEKKDGDNLQENSGNDNLGSQDPKIVEEKKDGDNLQENSSNDNLGNQDSEIVEEKKEENSDRGFSNLAVDNENDVDNKKENLSHRKLKVIDASASFENDKKLKKYSEVEIFEDDLIFGDINSDVVVVEYFSFSCPHCSYYYKNIFPNIKRNYIDTKKIAYVKREIVATRQDLEASSLARCSYGNSKREKFTDVLLKNQDNWAFNRSYHDILINIAQIGGVGKDNFEKCISDTKFVQLMLRNFQEASKYSEFIGTPFFLINGKPHADGFSESKISAEIDRLLANR